MKSAYLALCTLLVGCAAEVSPVATPVAAASASEPSPMHWVDCHDDHALIATFDDLAGRGSGWHGAQFLWCGGEYLFFWTALDAHHYEGLAVSEPSAAPLQNWDLERECAERASAGNPCQ